MTVEYKKIKIAMIVVDGNDVSGSSMSKGSRPSPAVHPAIEALLQGLSRRDDVECHVVYGQSYDPEQILRREGSLIYAGVPYQRFPGMGGAFIARYRAIQKYIQNFNPDLVHGQGTERECGLVAIFSKRPNVITLHGNFREIAKVFKASLFSYYWFAAKLEVYALKRTHAIFCISKYVEQISNQFRAVKYIIPNAVCDSFLEQGYKKSIKQDLPHVCCMGTIDTRKQTRFILEACEVLWKRGERFVLDVYGSSGSGQEYFDDFTNALKPWIEQGKAFYHGYTSDPIGAIRQSDVMVSASCEESFGMNVLEAMALGVPVVAPPVGGIQDILIPDETGLYFKEGDVESCADQIQKLITNPELRAKFSDRGKQLAKSKFSPDVVAGKTLEAYKEILSGRINNKH